MDCRGFRRHHLAYLDDTLSGNQTTEAQRHVLACDACAAHDTLVRRSLMIARSMPTIEPTAAFQDKLRARLAACRADVEHETSRAVLQPRGTPDRTTRQRAARAVVAVTAGTMLGALAWNGAQATLGRTTESEVIAMQPVVASQPAFAGGAYITPALMQAMSTGNPVWPAAMLLEDAPSYFVLATYNLAEDTR